MFNNNTLHIVLSSRTSVSASGNGYYIKPRHMPPKCLFRYVVVYTSTRTGCPPEGLSLVITNLISYSLTLLCDVLPCAVYMQRHIPLVYFLIKQSKICSLCIMWCTKGCPLCISHKSWTESLFRSGAFVACSIICIGCIMRVYQIEFRCSDGLPLMMHW